MLETLNPLIEKVTLEDYKNGNIYDINYPYYENIYTLPNVEKYLRRVNNIHSLSYSNYNENILDIYNDETSLFNEKLDLLKKLLTINTKSISSISDFSNISGNIITDKDKEKIKDIKDINDNNINLKIAYMGSSISIMNQINYEKIFNKKLIELNKMIHVIYLNKLSNKNYSKLSKLIETSIKSNYLTNYNYTIWTIKKLKPEIIPFFYKKIEGNKDKKENNDVYIRLIMSEILNKYGGIVINIIKPDCSIENKFNKRVYGKIIESFKKEFSQFLPKSKEIELSSDTLVNSDDMSINSSNGTSLSISSSKKINPLTIKSKSLSDLTNIDTSSLDTSEKKDIPFDYIRLKLDDLLEKSVEYIRLIKKQKRKNYSIYSNIDIMIGVQGFFKTFFI
jgi:hypothetical protein